MRFRRNRVSEWRGLNRVISMIERPKKASDAMLRYVTNRGFHAWSRALHWKTYGPDEEP